MSRSRLNGWHAAGHAAGDAHPRVSDAHEELILVDANDEVIGHLPKHACHQGEGVRHRAFSLFVVDHNGAILLQQRASGKQLWPGYWSNACCSHPRRGETVAGAVHRRAREELGMTLDELNFVYKFEYRAAFGSTGSEHELCWVFIAVSGDEPRPNRNEIASFRWCSPEAVDELLARGGEMFTPWFKREWARLRTEFRDEWPAAAYARPAAGARQIHEPDREGRRGG